MDMQKASSNWTKLKVILDQAKSFSSSPQANARKRKTTASDSSSLPQGQKTISRKKQKRSDRMDNSRNTTEPHHANVAAGKKPILINAGFSTSVEIGRYVAVDCEMVGVGPEPSRESALARVSIVNFDGEQVYDSYVQPQEEVTDWRTHVSGILPRHMLQARTLVEAQSDVCKILQDRVLIGHSVRHDLDALFLGHPKRDIRDTARHPPYRKLAGGGSPRLKILASELMGLEIQDGEHSSVEDARACMMLFRRDKAAFEREHAKRFPAPRPPPDNVGEATTEPKRSQKKKKKKKK